MAGLDWISHVIQVIQLFGINLVYLSTRKGMTPTKRGWDDWDGKIHRTESTRWTVWMHSADPAHSQHPPRPGHPSGRGAEPGDKPSARGQK